MGWKTVKNHYRIGHQVQMRGGQFLIGSPYISDIIVITPEGKFVKRYDRSGNEDLARYQEEIDADVPKFVELLAAPDVFDVSIPCWTFEGDQIIEKACEAMEWPNCTHDGQMIYENTFFLTPEAAAAYAYNCALATIDQGERHLAEKRKEMARIRGWRAEATSHAEKLAHDFPGMVADVQAKRERKRQADAEFYASLEKSD